MSKDDEWIGGGEPDEDEMNELLNANNRMSQNGRLGNDYLQAIEVEGSGVYAVQLADGGWSMADGPGSKLEQDICCQGWHIPVRFETQEQSLAAIQEFGDSGDKVTILFGSRHDGPCVEHAISKGGRFEPLYA